MRRLHVPVRLRWSDVDAYGHVNNAEMFRLLEEARIQAFWAPDLAPGLREPAEPGEGASETTRVLAGGADADTLSFIAKHTIEYLTPIPYMSEPIDVQLWLGRLGGASLDVCYEAHPPRGLPEPVYVRASTTIVLVDAATRRPRRLTQRERAAWGPYLGDPVTFNRH
ncbi:MAG TPA: thioesterase family protein [Microbacteriaceae bacterium]|nr:thioesterase family protein [Microbacteriaceae bacterium]